MKFLSKEFSKGKFYTLVAIHENRLNFFITDILSNLSADRQVRDF